MTQSSLQADAYYKAVARAKKVLGIKDKSGSKPRLSAKRGQPKGCLLFDLGGRYLNALAQ